MIRAVTMPGGHTLYVPEAWRIFKYARRFWAFDPLGRLCWLARNGSWIRVTHR